MHAVSVRRLVENEMFFKQPNQKVVEGLSDLEQLAEATDQQDLLPDTTQPIQFYCECSDGTCRKRIALTPGKYADLHKNHNQFIVLPGHEVPQIEHVITSTDDYTVVEKKTDVLQSVDTPNKTNIRNT